MKLNNYNHTAYVRKTCRKTWLNHRIPNHLVCSVGINAFYFILFRRRSCSRVFYVGVGVGLGFMNIMIIPNSTSFQN